MSQKNILVLSSDLPYPAISGGKIKTNKLLSSLASKHNVTLGCILKADDSNFIEEAQTNLPVDEIIYEKLDIPRNLKSFLSSIANKKTLNEFRTWSPELKHKIKTTVENADCILVDHYETMQYVEERFRNKCVLHTHNAEHAMWQRYAKIEKNPLLKLAITFEANRITSKELKYATEASSILIAPNDWDEFVSSGATKNDINFYNTLHLGDDSQLDLPHIEWSNTKNQLFFLGTLTWQPNIDGLKWFLEDCWPQIKEQSPETTLKIGGKHPPEVLVELTKDDNRVEILGFVDDPEVIFQETRVFICPLRFGSGTKVKVLNAMYRGIPTVTTPIGVEGLELKNKEDMWVADNSQEYIEGVVKLVSDEDLWTRVRDNSRNCAREKYTWGIVESELFKAIDEVIGD